MPEPFKHLVRFHTEQGLHTLEVPEYDTLCRAAIQCGLTIPTDCRHGICGTCEVFIQTGPDCLTVRACITLVDQPMEVFAGDTMWTPPAPP
ncbi:MAG: 2Fe-2S iron-sulfur cluster binding domain-containing protein [Gemmatimonadaceae bacterium]|nr:2Fe-2S iron-sulfur cluster binding domain-containing protein [Gloeobacterales cyanobacterium ES-bin-141]